MAARNEAASGSHRAGPALFGTLRFDERGVSWQAVYLLGRTYGQRGSMFSALLRYVF